MTSITWDPSYDFQGLPLLLMLWCGYRQEPSKAPLHVAQQTTDRGRCRYLDPTNGLKSVTEVEELENG